MPSHLEPIGDALGRHVPDVPDRNLGQGGSATRSMPSMGTPPHRPELHPEPLIGSDPVLPEIRSPEIKSERVPGSHSAESIEPIVPSVVGNGIAPLAESIAHWEERQDEPDSPYQERTQQNGNGRGDPAPEILPESEIDLERGLLPVLKNRNFLKLWSGQVFSQLADKIYLVLMIAIIASRFQSADQTISGWVSSLMIAFTIPAILFGSVAGVFVDHWRKRAVLVSTNLLRGGLVLSLPVLLWISHDWGAFFGMPVSFLVLLTVTFLVSTLTQFFAPAEQAVIPLIVERRHLLSANSLYTMTMMASVIVGFALGEPLLGWAEAAIAPIAPFLHLAPDMGKEILVGGSYAIAGLLLTSLNTQEKAVDPHAELPDVWENIKDGLRYLKNHGVVRAALIHLVILFSIFAALAVLAVRLAEVMPELKSSQFGFLLAAGGVGMAIGAVLIGQFGQRVSRAQMALYGSIGMAVSLAAISFFTHHLFPTLPLLVVLGACSAITGVPMQTAIQEETPEDMRGKVFGLQNNAINIALSLPLALAGIAENWFGLQAVFLVLSAMAIAGGILTWTISRSQNHSAELSSKIIKD